MTEFSDARLAEVISSLLKARGDGKTICPSEVARAVAGSDEKEWRRLMKPIRTVAIRMARDGRLTIRRKGRVVDPGDFKGVYRLGAAGAGRAEAEEPC